MIRSTFALPTAIGAASLVGLVSALAGDGLPDMLAWAMLATPILATAWAMRARRR